MAELRNILFVEDEADIQVIVRLALEKLGGFSVTACSSGPEALERLTEVQPQLILLDVMMPEMDGPATLEAIREIPGFEKTPVAFMTAKVQPHEVAHYHSLGATDVIVKPFDPITLPDQVRAVWEKASN